MKKIFITMIIVAVILVGGLTFIGFELKNKNKPYTNVEEELKLAAESYVGMYPSLITGNETKITNKEMIDHKYSEKLVVNNKKCDGYVIIKKSFSVYNYIPYIKCAGYETRGYEK